MINIFGNYSSREVKRLSRIKNKINGLKKDYSVLSLKELKEKAITLKEKAKTINSLDEILIEAFALCRECSKRILKMEHYDVQVIGGIALHQGRIAEMKTGEGKTLVATLPVYLNALTGEGVHIITVNDYLAERDYLQMKPLYDFLEVTSSVIKHNSSKEERRIAYNCDITYITNTELGFDYLRDNMVLKKEDKIMRKLNFCLVDEVDSILIDDARTPLIISGEGESVNHLYNMVDIFVKHLNEEDYKVDEEMATVYLTEKGVDKAEKIFVIDNLSDITNSTLFHYINQGLKANYYFIKDKDYIVKDNKVVLIDEGTGRVADGRRYSDGLHQAIESKEGVEVMAESKTLASITYQNFFKMYKKLSGMTGTGETEQNEFNETYNLDVVVIPTNVPVIRKDNLDKIYLTHKAKLKGIIEDVKDCYRRGQPVLIGTPNIEKSEELSELLSKFKIPHNVLNAKHHEREAEIISKAGKLKAVTIATNMAGRGTDIKLEEGVYEVGGLKVIGTERHNNRRIDNQLRGRSGRQGDPGESTFYLSFEDDLMRIYGHDKFKEMIDKLDKEEEGVIENKFLTNAINKAQKKLEGLHFDSRKETFKYDEQMNIQREFIYKDRDKLLEETNMKNQILFMTNTVLDSIVDRHFNQNEEFDFDNVLDKTLDLINNEFLLREDYLNSKDIKNIENEEELKRILKIHFENVLNKKESCMELELFNETAKTIILNILDENWRLHIDNLKELKRNLAYYSMKQVDPYQYFCIESGKLYEELLKEISYESLKYIYKLAICTNL